MKRMRKKDKRRSEELKGHKQREQLNKKIEEVQALEEESGI